MPFFWPFVTLITAKIPFWQAHCNQHHRIRYISCVTLVTCQMLNRVSQTSGEIHQFNNISGCAKIGWFNLKKKFCNEILTLFDIFLRLNKIKIRKKCKNCYTLIYSVSHFCCYPFRCELLKKLLSLLIVFGLKLKASEWQFLWEKFNYMNQVVFSQSQFYQSWTFLKTPEFVSFFAWKMKLVCNRALQFPL